MKPILQWTRDAERAAPIPLSAAVKHLHENGLAAELAAEGDETVTEPELLNRLFMLYGTGAVVGVAATERAVRDGVILFKESHSVEDEEEVTARRDIASVVARFGISVPESGLEDLGDPHNVARAIEAALIEANRPERVRAHDSRYYAISVLLIREHLVPGPLLFCSGVGAAGA